jgi:peptide/nickel transport system substrate-binding protein
VNEQGAGPYRAEESEDGVLRLAPIPGEDESETAPRPDILLRGEPAALAVARFAQNETDLVTGGTIGTLPFARAAGLGGDRLLFDPAAGLFGLAFASAEGPLSDPAVRAALSMAIDRQALIATLAVPGLQPSLVLMPQTADEVPNPAVPAWAASPMPMRRELATRTIAALDAPLRIRVAMPAGPGYRLVFAHLRRDWRLIGIEAEPAGLDAPAELRLIDAVAPGRLAGWYLRHFTCDAAPVCDTEADAALQAARVAPSAAERRVQLAVADRIFAGLTPFIPLASPVRWSLVAPRLNGFRPNPFARHPADTLIAPES